MKKSVESKELKQIRYSEEIAESVLEQVAAGMSLRSVCARSGMPDRSTVSRWEDAYPDFAARCARAKERRAEVLAERILDEAERIQSAEDAQVAKVRISALQWVASKLDPRRYGERSQVEHSGRVEGANIILAVQQIPESNHNI
jgi:hypothetical protein